MNFNDLDPSLSLGYLCATEKDFDDLCNRLRQDIVDGEDSPLLELMATRPAYMVEGKEVDQAGGKLPFRYVTSLRES